MSLVHLPKFRWSSPSTAVSALTAPLYSLITEKNSDVEHDRFAVPPWGTLMGYKVVVCSCSDAMILSKARCTNKNLARLEAHVLGGLYPHARKKPIKPHWTHLLIDEV